MISRAHSTPSFRAAARSAAPLAWRPALPLAWVLLVALSLSACDAPGARAPADDHDRPASSPDSAITVTDPTGRPVTLDGPARRVVSMMPAVTEWIIAMDAAGRLVARTDYDHHPALDTLPSVGGGLTPSIEWLAARRPDLVIAWPDAPSRSIVARLEQVGIAVYTAPIESIEESLTVAGDLGRLLGDTDAAGRAIAHVRAGLDSVRTAVAGRPTPTVLYLIGLEPLTAAGPGTFVDELVDVAGGRNALADLRIRWPQISLEEVVRRSPDVVILASVSAHDPATLLASRPGWRDVPAVRHGAVHALDPDDANRPGPHMARAAATLAELIHPGLDARPAAGDSSR